MSEEKLEAPNPFNQAQLQEASRSGDSLNFESNFWKTETGNAYDNNTYTQTNPSNAYDDKSKIDADHKPNAITSLFNNMKAKLNEKPQTETQSQSTQPQSNNTNTNTNPNTKSYVHADNAYGDNNAYGTSYDVEPTKPSKKENKSANLLSTNQITISHEELDKKEAYLDKREKQLLERKKRLEAVKHELTSSNIRRDNWPCTYYPITFHSIQQEIPPHARSHMKRMYTLVLLSFLCFISNTFAELVLYFNDVSKDSDILLAVIYLFCGGCGAWRLWYRQIYYGIRDRKTVKWWCFFVFFTLHVVFSIIMVLGLKKIGGAGMITMVNAFKKGKNFSGFICLMCAILWGVVAVGSCYYLKKSWVLFRQRGGVEQSRGEITDAVARHAVDRLV